MEDLQLKRKAIELGQLKTWSRRGKPSYFQDLCLRTSLLQAGLRLLGLYSRGERNARQPVVKYLRFSFDTLPETFSGFKILHLSDLHADGLPGLAESICERIRDLEVDVCVLTGDYRFRTSGPCYGVYANMERILARVNARHGIVGILGNHDWAEMIPEFERMGVTMLVNESLELRHGSQSIWLLGVDDPHYYGCDDLSRALLEIPGDAFKILLVHTPELIEEAACNGIHLYLCGHTHGGQICMPFIGPLITNANCSRKYARGVWQHKQVKGYTSAGVGCSGVPVRFFCPPELVLIELCRPLEP
jgi:hypothetical protein